MSKDVIYKQDALDALCKGCGSGYCGISCEEYIAIKNLPSAQPERKKGKWINHRKDRGHNIADCDQCGGTLQWLDPDERPNFCPDCGADMREEGDE